MAGGITTPCSGTHGCGVIAKRIFTCRGPLVVVVSSPVLVTPHLERRCPLSIATVREGGGDCSEIDRPWGHQET